MLSVQCTDRAGEADDEQGLPTRRLRRVPTELKKRIMAARLDKKLTQAQLGQLINEKPNVIQVCATFSSAGAHQAARHLVCMCNNIVSQAGGMLYAPCGLQAFLTSPKWLQRD